MGLSIQDYLKKINSWLRFSDIVSIFVLFLGISIFTGYIWRAEKGKRVPVIYQEGSVSNEDSQAESPDSGRPFGSRKGKTYTFSWCSGSGNIKQANKIYFASSHAAEAAGRTLSKLCKK